MQTFDCSTGLIRQHSRAFPSVAYIATASSNRVSPSSATHQGCLFRRCPRIVPAGHSAGQLHHVVVRRPFLSKRSATHRPRTSIRISCPKTPPSPKRKALPTSPRTCARRRRLGTREYSLVRSDARFGWKRPRCAKHERIFSRGRGIRLARRGMRGTAWAFCRKQRGAVLRIPGGVQTRRMVPPRSTPLRC